MVRCTMHSLPPPPKWPTDPCRPCVSIMEYDRYPYSSQPHGTTHGSLCVTLQKTWSLKISQEKNRRPPSAAGRGVGPQVHGEQYCNATHTWTLGNAVCKSVPARPHLNPSRPGVLKIQIRRHHHELQREYRVLCSNTNKSRIMEVYCLSFVKYTISSRPVLTI